MRSKKPAYLFISYRREDSQWIARALHRYLSERLGSYRVFMDRVEIRGGDNWKDKINQGLESATVVLAIIGRHWLTLSDTRTNRPRINHKNDWVRHEIRTALDSERALIPVFVDGAKFIEDKKILPEDIRDLTDQQGIVLTPSDWDERLANLVRRIADFGFELHDVAIPMPQRRKRVEPLTTTQLDAFARTHRGWSVTSTEFTMDARPVQRTELYREYRFHSFQDATQFMAEASPEIDAGQHHPRWENIWTTVRVWLCTWDIEFRPSKYDVRLAKTLDRAYARFRGRSTTQGQRPGKAPPLRPARAS